MKLPALTPRTIWLVAPATQMAAVLVCAVAMAGSSTSTGTWHGDEAATAALAFAALAILVTAWALGAFALAMRDVRKEERANPVHTSWSVRGSLPSYLVPRANAGHIARGRLAWGTLFLCLAPLAWMLTGRHGLIFGVILSIVLGAVVMMSSLAALARVAFSDVGRQVVADVAAQKIPTAGLPPYAAQRLGGDVLMDRLGAPTGSATADVAARLLAEDVPAASLAELVDLAASIASTPGQAVGR